MESEDYIAPEAGDELEEGAIDTYHQEDDVDQDDYWIRVYEGNITPNEVTAVPLNLSVFTRYINNFGRIYDFSEI